MKIGLLGPSEEPENQIISSQGETLQNSQQFEENGMFDDRILQNEEGSPASNNSEHESRKNDNKLLENIRNAI